MDNIDDVRVAERTPLASEAQVQLGTVFAILLGADVLMLAAMSVKLFARFCSCVWDRKSKLALYQAVKAKRVQLLALFGGEVEVIVAIDLVKD